ncbi:metallophosphoesterase [Falsirhodobacter algicola]|uniref:Serine/threonine protein phosphatase n=1 Tax=Falsirhodobacter algicola TaxID=2692330 RepID=A0A8J8MTG4_9RHOB|nr:metallophosphoesterase [Falsirhodobacter algicola]QUS36154.1 serine/threonine protein phosphatase [Falsirhodobacter algicola]
MHIYAIGDIHGQIDLLHGAHALIARDAAEHGTAPVVHIGDLVDRGPDSAGVIEHLRQGIARGEPWVVLKGNHDRLFSRFLEDPGWHDPGLRPDYGYLHPKIGGAATLASYGVRSPADRPIRDVHADAVAAVPQAHRDFLESCPVSFRRPGLYFCHAGIRPTAPLSAQSEQDLCWIRKGFLDVAEPFEALIVHGHTAIDHATHYDNRVNIDSSAAYGGPLSAVVIEGTEAFLLTESGRKPIPAEAPGTH